MIRKLTAALGVVLFATGAPGSAQSNHHAPPGPSPFASVPAPRSAEELAAAISVILESEEARETIAGIESEMSVTGEPVPGWSANGVFFPDLVAGSEGGTAANVSLSDNRSPPMVKRWDAIPFDMPEGYRQLVLKELKGGEPMSRKLTAVFPGLWIEVTGRYQRVGNAICYDNEGGIVVHVNDDMFRWTEESLSFLAFIYGIVEASLDPGMCTIYKQVGDNTYITLTYDPEGRPYTAMNTDRDEYEIHPAAEATARILAMPIEYPISR